MIQLDALMGAQEACAQTEGTCSDTSDRWGILEDLRHEIAHAASPSLALLLMEQLMALQERKRFLDSLQRMAREGERPNKNEVWQVIETQAVQSRFDHLRRRAQLALMQ